MAVSKLTDQYIAKLKPDPTRQIVIWDSRLAGFGIVVGTTGAKSYVVQRRVNGRVARRVLGKVEEISFAKAHKRARDWLDDMRRGTDPKPAPVAGDSVAAVLDRFIVQHVKQLRPRSASDNESWLNANLRPAWGTRPIREIGRKDVHALLDKIEVGGHRYARNHGLAYTRKFFNWCLKRDLVDGNPASLIDRLPEKARDRVLTDSELVELWKAFDAMPYPTGPFLKLLTLTGQRRDEIASLRWSEVNAKDGTIELAADRYKTGQPHIVPLSAQAKAVLEGVIRMACDHTFTSNNRTPISGFSKFKATVDRLVLEARQQADPNALPMADWRFHDLRRTCRTVLPKLGVSSDHAERVMGHRLQGVRAAYDRFEYLPQKRAALEAWAAYIESLVNPPSDTKVVQLAKRRRAKA